MRARLCGYVLLVKVVFVRVHPKELREIESKRRLTVETLVTITASDGIEAGFTFTDTYFPELIVALQKTYAWLSSHGSR
jgi:hypothetical protein